MEKKNSNKALYISSAIFIVLMGIVSMMSDMTHEGAKSIYGLFLADVGASPMVISLISGLGELLGCSLIFVTGIIANKTKKYWTMTIIGYTINLLAIPLLALTTDNGWIYACFLILFERFGKAIRKPAKSTLVSFSGKNLGEGKSFAFVEFLDQIGAFIGPLILTLVLHIKGSTDLLNAYRLCFMVLGIPAVITLVILLIARIKYPNPENLEEDTNEVKENTKFHLERRFVFYLIAISLCAFSFIDFPLVTYHIELKGYFETANIPMLYSLAMLVDAIAALVFGILFDRVGIIILVPATLLALLSPLFIFFLDGKVFLIIGVILWGIGMGSQESILKSAVAKLVPKNNRSLGFGIFEGLFGFAWFIGSFVLGLLYEKSLLTMVILSIGFQVISIPFLFIASTKKKEVLE